MPAANVEQQLKHLFDGGDLNVYAANILNLGVGAPGTDLLENCCSIFQKATAHRLQHEKEVNRSLLFQYGPTSGCYEVRHEIAKYFSKMYDSTMLSEDLIITTGATQGLHFVLSTLIDFNGFIFVDEYTYMIALDLMKQFTTLNIVPIKLNEDGVDLTDLEAKVRQRSFSSKSKLTWGIYYTIPTYHNPTGILFSPAVCRGIVQLARKFDFLVICDDVYNVLCYGEQPPHARLLSYDVRTDADFMGHVISNGSFSKIIGPGVRLGWLEVPARLKAVLDRSGIIHSGGCFNNYTSGILASLFELQLAQSHIARLYEAYKERMLAVTAVLKEQLPNGCSMLKPSGGYFIWIRLPDRMCASEFLKYSMEHAKVFFIPGERFTLEPDKGKQYFRLSIGFHCKQKLVDGIMRLCQALKDYIKTLNAA